jgi:hypothetical protein
VNGPVDHPSMTVSGRHGISLKSSRVPFGSKEGPAWPTTIGRFDGHPGGDTGATDPGVTPDAGAPAGLDVVSSAVTGGGGL